MKKQQTGQGVIIDLFLTCDSTNTVN